MIKGIFVAVLSLTLAFFVASTYVSAQTTTQTPSAPATGFGY